jgi:hypothetical protein
MSQPLRGKIVAISVSESQDMPPRGLEKRHLEEALLEMTRRIILQGGSVAYGGDFRQGGFTMQLVELAATLEARDTPLLRIYVAWPLYVAPDSSTLSTAELSAPAATLVTRVRVLELPEVTGRIAELREYLPPTTDASREIWAHNLTAMRTQMARECDARIVMGGRLEGWSGAMPGVVEEAVATIDAGKPLYVVGSFGGAAEVVFNGLVGRGPTALAVDERLGWNPGHAELLDRLRRPEGSTTIHDAATRLRDVGLSGLRNGLDEAENLRLQHVVVSEEIADIVIAGLGIALREQQESGDP